MNGTLLGQTKGSDAIVFLYDEKGNKYGFDYNGTKYYYIFNVQGDVIGILNQAGQKIVSYTYDPWGRLLSIGGPQVGTIGQLNPIRYRGYYYDTETGFYYFRVQEDKILLSTSKGSYVMDMDTFMETDEDLRDL